MNQQITITICPKWDECRQFKCHDRQVCTNGEFWSKYWGSEATAEKMATIRTKPKKQRQYKKDWIGVCYYCERKLTGVLRSTRDHIIPISQDGSNDPRNLIESCERCNTLKANRTAEEFADFLGYLLNSDIHTHIAKNSLILILYNTRNLIKKIAPYRHELYKVVVELVKIPEVSKPIVIPKAYPPIKYIATICENEDDKWLKGIYLPNCHPDPSIFVEK